MTVTINGKEYKGITGQTILSLASENNINIPTMCHGEELPPSGACGICVVEVTDVPRLLRACATPISNGMVIHTQSEKVISARKTLLELSLSTHSGDCAAPCRVACPAKTDCQGYISLIAEGKTNEAVMLMKEAHPFPASIARICPRPCEEKCRRKLVDEAVNIAGLKRYATDLSVSQIPQILPETGNVVAIIGGGPAGLTAAYFLRRGGHMVDVFEQMPKMGGLLRYGIPEYRLPKAILDKELAVLQKIGIAFKNNMTLGEDFTIDQLQAKYDVVVIAIGAGASKPMWCKGEDAQNVWGGINFLKAIAKNESFSLQGKRVIVVGGSNTAMDTARTALRLGAEVIVSYRRTRDEMPAEKAEMEEAVAEGVQFLFLTAPKEITTLNGHATGITLQKMILGEPDASGRRSPIPQEGESAVEWVQADMIIGAIGQDVVMAGLSPLENLAVDNNFRTQLPGVYAIGDATGKSSYAIDAIAHGKKVATVVLDDMRLPWETLPQIIVEDTKIAADFLHVPTAPRQQETFIKTISNLFAETHTGLTQEQAAEEAKRCLSCGCEAFEKCKLLKLSNMYKVEIDKFPESNHKKIKHPIDRRGHIHRDINKCVHCYLCVSVCSQIADKEVFSAIDRGFNSIIDTAFGEQMPNECKDCKKCVEHCPTGALFST